MKCFGQAVDRYLLGLRRLTETEMVRAAAAGCYDRGLVVMGQCGGMELCRRN